MPASISPADSVSASATFRTSAACRGRSASAAPAYSAITTCHLPSRERCIGTGLGCPGTVSVAVRTRESGITIRGKCILRTSASLSIPAVTDRVQASVKKVKSTMFISSRTG